MNRSTLHAILFCLLAATATGYPASEGANKASAAAISAAPFEAGTGSVDITPTGEVILAGSPTLKKTSTVAIPLFAKALVISASGQKVAIVTLDTLKYPMSLALEARKRIEQNTGIPVGNVIICASHTHSGPLWTSYKDRLITPICEAVNMANRDLEPCKLGVSKGKVEGLNENRRVVKEGTTWNRWQLPPAEAERYPAEGPADPEVEVLAVVGKDGRYKAILFNYACHAAYNHSLTISADFPGEVRKHVREQLGYDAPTLFLTGACGDVNPTIGTKGEDFAEKLGGEVLRCAGQIEFIAKPAVRIESRQEEIAGREHPVFNQADVALKWPGQVEHYQMSYASMKLQEKPAYPCPLTGIRIGDDFALVTCPVELFNGIGMSIKKQSPFKYTMVVEQTNGAHGYVPTAGAFAGGGYETWYGLHSYLSTQAGEIIEKESVDILKRLKSEN
jgi:hypothetical protein